MNWLDKWQRSPRQDRRVVVDGKFVELTPRPDVTEREQSALEVVEEQVNVPVREQSIDAVAEHLEGSISVRKIYEALTGPAVISYPTGSLGEHVPDENTTIFKLGEEGIVATISEYQDYSTNAPLVDLTESEKLQDELEPLPTEDDSIPF